MQHELLVRNKFELFRYAADTIAAVCSDGNYCYVKLSDGTEDLLPFQLGHIEHLCHEQLGSYAENLIRIGRSLILNIEYVWNINIKERYIRLRLPQGKKLKLDHLPPEALKALKDYMERTLSVSPIEQMAGADINLLNDNEERTNDDTPRQYYR